MLTNNQQREEAIECFLSEALNCPYQRHLLAADASFRRYERVIYDNKPCVLMDAPPPQEDVRPFVAITRLLHDCGLHAPALMAEDAKNGFLLLEDFGDDSFRKHIEATPDDEWPLYEAAIEVLLHLRESLLLPQALPAYDHSVYLRELEVFADWYLPKAECDTLKPVFLKLWEDLLAQSPIRQNSLVLRDYHADNLMWLPQQSGLARVGLLDYQDALIGDAAYDLVSLLEDARRDVCPTIVQKAFDLYISQSGENAEEFKARYAILGAQRNLKIIGIFNRLNRRDGKSHYLDLLPRVWTHLENDFNHPALEPICTWMQTHNIKGISAS